MKVFLKIILVIITIPIFILFVLSINFRFQFLSANFWKNTFTKGDIYSQIFQGIDKKLLMNVATDGGSRSDVETLSSLISPNNLQDLIEGNINNFLSFANGKSTEILVYIPPFFKNSVPTADNTDRLSNGMKLSDFLREFNISTINEKDIALIYYAGSASWILLFGSFTLLVLFIFLMYLLIQEGKQLVPIGITLSFSGVVILAMCFVGNIAQRMLSNNFAESQNLSTSFTSIILSPVIQNIVQVWIWFGVITFCLGVLLFFLKKPAINKSK